MDTLLSLKSSLNWIKLTRKRVVIALVAALDAAPPGGARLSARGCEQLGEILSYHLSDAVLLRVLRAEPRYRPPWLLFVKLRYLLQAFGLCLLHVCNYSWAEQLSERRARAFIPEVHSVASAELPHVTCSELTGSIEKFPDLCDWLWLTQHVRALHWGGKTELSPVENG